MATSEERLKNKIIEVMDECGLEEDSETVLLFEFISIGLSIASIIIPLSEIFNCTLN